MNVLIALVAIRHKHHDAVRRRFADAGPGEWGVCRIVQLGLVRLLGAPAVMGQSALPAADGWRTSQDLLQDERLSLLPEPRALDEFLAPMLRYNVPTPKLVTDAYLAAFSVETGRTLLTLDQGFRQFDGIDLELLAQIP